MGEEEVGRTNSCVGLPEIPDTPQSNRAHDNERDCEGYDSTDQSGDVLSEQRFPVRETPFRGPYAVEVWEVARHERRGEEVYDFGNQEAGELGCDVQPGDAQPGFEGWVVGERGHEMTEPGARFFGVR